MSIKAFKYGKTQVNINEKAIAGYRVLNNDKKTNAFYSRFVKKYMVLLTLIGEDAPYIYVGVNKGFDYFQEAERTMICIMEGEGENSNKWFELERNKCLEEYDYGINSKTIRVHYDDCLSCTLVVDDDKKKYRLRMEIDGLGSYTFKNYFEDKEEAIEEAKKQSKYDGLIINDKEVKKRMDLLHRLEYEDFNVRKEDKNEKWGYAYDRLKAMDVTSYGFKFIMFDYMIVFNDEWEWTEKYFKTEEEAEKTLKKIFKEKFDELKKVEIDNTKELEKSKEMTKKIQSVSSKVLPILSIIFGVVGIGLVVLGHLTNDENFRFISVLPALVATLLLEILLSFKIKIKIPKIVYIVLSIVILIVVMIIWWQVICGIKVF